MNYWHGMTMEDAMDEIKQPETQQGEVAKANDAPFRIARGWYPHNTEMCLVVQSALDRLEMALDMALRECAALRSQSGSAKVQEST